MGFGAEGPVVLVPDHSMGWHRPNGSSSSFTMKCVVFIPGQAAADLDLKGTSVASMAARLARQSICDGYPAPVRCDEPPPLPFANLGPIRLFINQPVKGRLDASRAALGDSAKGRTPPGDCRAGPTLRGPGERGMDARA